MEGRFFLIILSYKSDHNNLIGSDFVYPFIQTFWLNSFLILAILIRESEVIL